MSEAREQISSYLLGELGADDAASFERALAADSSLRMEVEGLRPLVADLEALPGEAWDPPEPPPLRMPADAAGRERAQVADSDAGEAGRRRGWLRLPAVVSLAPLRAAALAVLLVATGVVVGSVVGAGGDGSSPVAALTMSRIDDGPSGAHGTVELASGERRATVAVGGLDPSGDDRFYELWLLDEDGRMIALGSFPVGDDGSAEVELPIPVPPARYAYFDLSLQEDNGDPAHSGVSVLRGPTSS